MIEKRLVFVFPGFEPMLATAHMERFRRAAERSASIWAAELRLDQAKPSASAPADTLFPSLHATLGGTGWRTETELIFCEWGDLIFAYRSRPAIERLSRGLLALTDFLVTGTVFHYCRVSWRYAFFFAFPIVVITAALLIGWLVHTALTALLAGTAGSAIGSVLGFVAALAWLFLAERRWHLLTAMDDWALARDLCRERNPALSARIERQAEEIAALAAASEAGEIVVAAHSLGASFAVLALDRALADGHLESRQWHILTVGSSLLKTALHPAARTQRAAVRRLVADHRIAWTDCQGLSDPINFYNSNPATSLGLRQGRTPLVVRVHFRRLVSPPTYRRIKRDFFRLHRQFVLAVERRCPYSFHMLLLGPRPLADFAATKSVDVPPLAPSAREGVRA
ncbi:hypothetical protein [Aurantimonas marianensis]|uniref:Uncharacterized protein n=1 Tax=Aurantimonas marianensis TaxID=2920428 RepID=A0A9X2KGM1_9HYPH|nr:hypothetical protein [Aurantimonas marianensis]MCP3056606.1 hypothetical protein [Aurantimonas marianensis]